jgi:hypothetical protein
VADENKMMISDFTMPELEYLRQQCNFVNLEKDVFELRAQGIPLERIAEQLNISPDYARKLSQRVNKKIIKII